MAPLRWLLAAENPAHIALSQRLQRETDLPGVLTDLLVRRGCETAPAVQDFLHPRLSLLADPLALPAMPAAVDRILRALTTGERIALYGDYDVDGVTSLAILSELLLGYGGDVHCFLPLRIEEGYGLSADGVARCLETLQPSLLIAVDCGTASVNEIAFLQAQGVDVVVFDHHEAQASLPPCVALVNPKLGPAFHYLCSAGVVFKACHALLKRRPLPGFDLKSSLDLVALATVADLVPLVGENRLFVQRGSRQIAETRRPGLRALLEVAGVGGPVRTVDIGFRLGPRLNAAGRLGTAQAALDLLTTHDVDHARTLAVALDEQNRERQAVEQRTLLEAEALIAEDCVAGSGFRHAAIVVGARGWHPGVLGIVASRLMRTHHRPALVIGFDDQGRGKGSGRSIEGLSLVGALAGCARWLEKFGGHEMAAGLSLRESDFVEFQAEFRAVARVSLTAEQLTPRLRLDAEITLERLGGDFLAWHELLQPFGMGNPQPTFLVRGVVPAAEPRVLKEKHRKFLLRQRGGAGSGAAVPAIYFNSAHLELPPPPWDAAIQVEANEYRGNVSLQIQLQALRPAA